MDIRLLAQEIIDTLKPMNFMTSGEEYQKIIEELIAKHYNSQFVEKPKLDYWKVKVQGNFTGDKCMIVSAPKGTTPDKIHTEVHNSSIGKFLDGVKITQIVDIDLIYSNYTRK